MKQLIVLFFYSLFPTLLGAQTFTAQTSSNKVAVGQAFQITYTLNGGGNNFRPPSFKDFDVYSGPNQSSSMSIINGNVSQSISLSYVIAAKKEGKFTIEPAGVVMNGKMMESNEISIEVVGQSAATNNGGAKKSSSNTGESGDNIFAKTIVSNSNVFLGEQITVTHKVYSRFQIIDIKDIKFPSYTGFWTEDAKDKNSIQVFKENINGIVYQVAEIKKSYLFPQRSGVLNIDPIEVQCVVRRQSNRAPRDIFEQFFGGQYEDVLVNVKSKKSVVDCLPLPRKNESEHFRGAVGNYAINVNLSKDKVKANEAINLTVRISGVGNLKLVDAPEIDFPEDFEKYDPRITENITTEKGTVGGTKTFDYLLIPRHEGEYKIVPFSFSYFNPETKKYVEIPLPEFIIQVEKGEENTPVVTSFNAINKEELKILSNDIRYIKTGAPSLKPMNHYFFGSALFYALLFAPILVFSSFVVVRKKQIQKNSDVITLKSRKANKAAKKKLAIAEQHMRANNKELFYSEILKALLGYLGDKYNIQTGELGKERIEKVLYSKQVDETTVKQLVETIHSCEYAKYAPSAVSADLSLVYKNTVQLIEKLESI